MAGYTTILFDWDGCLADTTAIWLKSYYSAVKKRGLDPTYQEIREKCWGNHELGPKNLGVTDYVDCWQEVVDETVESLKTVSLHPNALEVISKLKALNTKVAIVTSSFGGVVRSATKHSGLDSLIDLMLSKEDVTKLKPDPEIIHLALTKLGSTKVESLIVGDTEGDVLSGKAAGITTVLITHPTERGYHDMKALRATEPDYIIEDFNELLGILR